MLEYNAAAISDAAGSVSISEEIDQIEDREVNFTLSRDDEGCDIAFNQIVPVFAAVTSVTSSINSGIVVNSTDTEKYKKDIKFLEKRKKEIGLNEHLSTCLDCRELYGCGAIGISYQNGNVLYLNDINTKRESDYGSFRLTTHSRTGRLGVKNVDPKEPNKVVTAVQVGKIIKYNERGEADDTGEEIYTYFTDDNIAVLGNRKLGRIRGQSSVMRILRYAETLIRLENTISLLSRRPTQLVYIAGNEQHNLLNCEVPQSYMEAAGGDRVQAKLNYKAARLAALNTEAKKLADGNVLAQVLEYGTDMKSVEIPEGLPYTEYVRWFEQQIKEGITTIDTSGRRVVRSRQQEASFRGELVKKSEVERELVINWLNNNITKKLLKNKRVSIDDVWFEFKPAVLDDKAQQARIWVDASQAVRNFAQAGIPIPEKLKEFLEIGGEWEDDKHKGEDRGQETPKLDTEES